MLKNNQPSKKHYIKKAYEKILGKENNLNKSTKKVYKIYESI